MSVLTRATQRNILEDGILYSHRCENRKTFNFVIVLFETSSGVASYEDVQKFINIFDKPNFHISFNNIAQPTRNPNQKNSVYIA
jgi:hypothetical protein